MIEVVKRNDICNGFGFMSLEKNDSERVIELFNGTTFKGGKLKIELSKPDYLQRLQTEKDLELSKLIQHEDRPFVSTNIIRDNE